MSTKRASSQAVQRSKAYSDAGGQVLFGTDVGYIDRFDTAEEFQLMSRAGMNFLGRSWLH
jgi:2-methylisocitrate lyase-like PEP mutase family enzyme